MLGKSFSLELSYLFSRGIHLSRNRNLNWYRRTGAPSPLNPLGGATFNPATDRPDPTVVKDWSVSPIFVAQSGRPFNLLLGGIDSNNDLRSSSDRPGQAGRNTGIGEDFYSFDLRLARRLLVKESRFLELTFEAFNLFNQTNLQGDQ